MSFVKNFSQIALKLFVKCERKVLFILRFEPSALCIVDRRYNHYTMGAEEIANSKWLRLEFIREYANLSWKFFFHAHFFVHFSFHMHAIPSSTHLIMQIAWVAAGVEPRIFDSVGERSNHCATSLLPTAIYTRMSGRSWPGGLKSQPMGTCAPWYRQTDTHTKLRPKRQLFIW
jgi:hypothetical protein